ncbi:hypothetical protein CHS0354_034217 [Potamilus streckersoni]|uniref:Uncharacterized protein n=1 Tax=Potamilus streckersoni TaxID=2493646 RepID=A0AAE0T2Q7_9BIVA|nr:hypothetical protein CHS0354_034217 [Potamilus streckersoni]
MRIERTSADYAATSTPEMTWLRKTRSIVLTLTPSRSALSFLKLRKKTTFLPLHLVINERLQEGQG